MKVVTPEAAILTRYLALTVLVIAAVSVFIFWAIRRLITATFRVSGLDEDDGAEKKNPGELLSELESLEATPHDKENVDDDRSK